MVLFNGLDKDPEKVAEFAQVQAEKIRNLLSCPYHIQGHELHITPSIGIALFPLEEESADDILRHADTAMYRAKEAGRNAVRFFLPSMQLAAEELLHLKNHLGQALEKNELSLHYQPQVDQNGDIVGLEALLRWQHSQRGTVPPDDFISMAEDTGQILGIGEWVLASAMRQFQAWSSNPNYEPPQRLAVNVSPRQFRHPVFPMLVARLLAETGADPACLTLEITEGVLLDRLEETAKKMQTLKKLGVRFSIDDFGTGYSSLGYLQKLPVDEIKIDRLFIQDLCGDPEVASLVETIIAMANKLGLETVGEGVENDEQRHFLQDSGCCCFQGHHFYCPQTVQALDELFRKPTSRSNTGRTYCEEGETV